MGELKYNEKTGNLDPVTNPSDYKRVILNKMEKLPFYTDDPDDPHWQCKSCAHCKFVKIHKRIVSFHPQQRTDDKGITRKNGSVGTVWVTWDRAEFEEVQICDLLNCETYDDQFCENFMEVEDGPQD